MNHWQYAVHTVLAGFIECLWVSKEDFTPQDKVIEILPDSSIELIFGFESNIWVKHAGITHNIPKCFAVGLLVKPILFGASGPVTAIAARFNAWGFYSLVGLGMTQQKPIGNLGDEWLQLASQIESVLSREGHDEAVQVLHRFLIERALNATYERHILDDAMRELKREKGQIDIEALADRCNVSRRQLEREFRAKTRTSPKSLSQLVRFQHARDALWRDPSLGLAALATDAGYTDQAHFTREFRRFAHRTPRQFAQQMHATRSLLSASGVAFFQDT